MITLRRIEKNVAFCHYALLVGSVISILDLAFDHKFSKRATDSADEYAVRIYDYISGHFTTPLTAEMMTEKFSISKWYWIKSILILQTGTVCLKM